MECVEKVESKKEALESAFEDLITHIHDMESTSFQPPTDPYEMAQSVELTINQKSRETKEKLETHQDGREDLSQTADTGDCLACTTSTG